jgi:hypothetical protein
MDTTIIDANGKPWDGASPLLREKLCGANTSSNLLDQALSAGFVVLHRHALGSIKVNFRPKLVNPVALVGAAHWLDDRAYNRIDIECGPGERKRSFIDNCTTAIVYLMDLADAAQGTRKHDFQSQRHASGAVALDASFGRLYEAWRATPGIKNQRLMEAVREASRGRYLEVDPQDGASKLVLDVVGEGYSLYGNSWKSGAVGGKFEDMPDFDYARRAAQAYREAFRTGQPIFEDVTAVVHLLRTGPLLLRYRRAILPIGGGDQPALLLGATLNQQVTHLPVGAVDELGNVRH